jgi:hypothetical protein
VKIKVEQSGGFAGISSSNEVDSGELPPSIKGTVRELLDKRRLPPTKDPGRRKVVADCIIYKIIIRNGKEDRVFEFNEREMESSIKSLINYIQKNSQKACEI